MINVSVGIRLQEQKPVEQRSMTDGYEHSLKKDLTDEVHALTRWTLSSLVDALFVALWLALQWVPKKAAAFVPPDGLDVFFLTAFQWVFGITTLTPIMFHFVKNTLIMFYQVRREIRDARRKAESDLINS